MKKTIACLLALTIVSAGSSLKAADTENVDTPNLAGTAEGSISATIDGTPLSQMKATVPISINFVIARVAGEDAVSNIATIGLPGTKYPITAIGSDVNVKLSKITVSAAPTNGWNLTSTINASTPIKTVMLNMAGKNLVIGDNPITSFKIDKSAVAGTDLAVVITPSQISYNDVDGAVAANAFNVVYTLEQDI